MAALAVPCEVCGGEGKATPGLAVCRPFCQGPHPVHPTSPASITTVTDGDIYGGTGLSPLDWPDAIHLVSPPSAAIGHFSTSIPGHSWVRAGMTGVPYRGAQACLTMASARSAPDTRFPCKANGEPGHSSRAAVHTFMAKGACS